MGLHYAHRPGVARKLNAYMAKLCRSYPQLTGMATVYPGEDGVDQILTRAFDWDSTMSNYSLEVLPLLNDFMRLSVIRVNDET